MKVTEKYFAEIYFVNELDYVNKEYVAKTPLCEDYDTALAFGMTVMETLLPQHNNMCISVEKRFVLNE